jgi:hypothetical protein
MMRPLIVLVLVQLLYSMVLSIFIYRGLSVSKMNTLVEGAQLIIEDFKAQQLTPGFLNISNSDFGKYPSTGCPPNWNLTKLGSFPGTSKGNLHKYFRLHLPNLTDFDSDMPRSLLSGTKPCLVPN